MWNGTKQTENETVRTAEMRRERGEGKKKRKELKRNLG
jgi:hypothetical protein